MRGRKLLYIHIGLSSFVNKDIAILEEEFDLKLFHFEVSNKAKLPLSFLKELFFLIFNANAIGIVIQFAGYHSYLPTLFAKLFRKKAILILGGTDTVSFPSIKYGCFYTKYLKYFTAKSLKNASLLLPVSDTLIKYQYTYTSDDFSEQGYLVHAPYVKTDAITIQNGYNASKWPFHKEKEQNSFLTIAADLGTRFGKNLKGIDLIIQIASSFPEAKFYIVGGDKLNEDLPANVIPVGNISNDKLADFIGDKQFYLQLSMSEGFPNALCEAMLCGCVPIVSNVGAMPEIVGTDGYILKQKNIELLVKLIRQAQSQYSIEKAKKASSRIAENYSIERRKKHLLDTISKHLQ